jgi:hypothetical protein
MWHWSIFWCNPHRIRTAGFHSQNALRKVFLRVCKMLGASVVVDPLSASPQPQYEDDKGHKQPNGHN